MASQENPAAFPSRQDVPHGNGGSHREDYPGMTLRDYFAGQVLAARAGQLKTDAQSTDEYYAVGAYIAYRYADAMLLQREEQSA